jgi:predicted TIM-barrel fold metal-dependent hydrolase
MDAEGIDRAILVHPEPYGDDHSLVLDCLDREPNRFRGTSLFYPNDPEGPSKLRSLVASQPGIISTRFHAHRGKDLYLKTFDDAGVVALWEAAAQLGLWVELHIGPNYAAQTVGLIETYPDTLVLIDHLAEPHTGSGVEIANVMALARYDNVYMKLSGLNHFAQDAPFYESALPFTRMISDAFGAERMIWGSGTPRIVDAHLAHLSESERDRVRGGNLAALIDW